MPETRSTTDSAAATATAAAEVDPQRRPVRVLLVEDNPGDARLAQIYLEEEAPHLPNEVRWVRSLSETLEAVGDDPPDVILLDLSLPDSTGMMDTFTTVHEKARHLPIIVLSGQSDEELALRMVKKGAQDHLAKNSLAPDLMGRSIRYAIERKNVLEQLRATQMQLIQAEKLESIGRLAAGVAHEVKNPLARIQLGLDYLRGGLDPEDPNLPIIFDRIESAVRRADAIICEMVNFSSERRLDFQTGPLEPVVRSALVLIDHELKKRGVRTIVEMAPDLPEVRIDHGRFEQVLINLLLNALQAMDEEPGRTGEIRVSARAFSLSKSGPDHSDRTGRGLRAGERVVELEIADNGPGIPPNKIASLFDPFFTTKPTGEGTGLGLTVVRKIVDLHDGQVTLENREDGPGARARILLRAQGGPAEAAEPPDPSPGDRADTPPSSPAPAHPQPPRTNP